MRNLYHESKSGNIYGNVDHFEGAEVMAFSMIGRDHAGYSWVYRYQNRNNTGTNYEVQTNNNKYRVIETPNNPATIYSRQTFYFDKTKGMAIVRCTLENVYQNENKVVKLSDIRYEDFKQIKGFQIPFKVLRKAESPDLDITGIQDMTVKEVTLNDDSHEKFLRDFTFPNGSSVYDHTGNPFTLVFVSLGIFIVIAIVLWIIIRKRRTGCGILLLIVYCIFSATSAFATNPNINHTSSHDTLDDLIPEHRAVHERDMTRLCGVNCLYQACLLNDSR